MPAVFGPMAGWRPRPTTRPGCPSCWPGRSRWRCRAGWTGGAGPARGRAGRDRQGGRRPPRPAGRPGGRARRPGPPARAARRGQAAAGGGRRPGWTEAAAADLRVAEASRLPVAVSFRSQDVLDNRSSSYVGDLGVSPNPALAERVRAADLVVAVGRASGRSPPAPTGCWGRRSPASASSTSTPAWPSWAGSTSRTWPSTRPWPVPGRLALGPAGRRRRLVGLDGGGPDQLSGLGAAPGRRPARSTSAR